MADEMVTIGDLKIRFDPVRVTVRGEQRTVTTKQAALLKCLANASERGYWASDNDIVSQVWEEDDDEEDEEGVSNWSISQTVSRLNKRLGGRYIVRKQDGYEIREIEYHQDDQDNENNGNGGDAGDTGHEITEGCIYRSIPFIWKALVTASVGTMLAALALLLTVGRPAIEIVSPASGADLPTRPDCSASIAGRITGVYLPGSVIRWIVVTTEEFVQPDSRPGPGGQFVLNGYFSGQPEPYLHTVHIELTEPLLGVRAVHNIINLRRPNPCQ